ncbi:4-alpha-glucanotransferase [Anaerococcus sp. AGMB00486]|uniref:4-alpha-glucanotransferase n=1 Tax=Anaerococcus faecalis TaxID=2742993 RepID=A0ABX2NBF7_9FIRM|nr:4-alpha-glucanotransferase [Anaerococcus faecalis]NVF12036.1 4-alpha-glucanotransferase [Anaerococcus faecalis]
MKKNKRFKRSNGIIMPIFSLPSDYGIGTFGKEAYKFIDFLAKASIGYWQILPLGPTSYGDSPYQSFSSFAGNPYFIDLDLLSEDGLIEKDDYSKLNFGEYEEYIDYSILYNIRFRILKKAYENIDNNLKEKIEEFKKEEEEWLKDYCLFMAIKKDQLDISWIDFDKDLRNRNPKALKDFTKKHIDDINFYAFIQYEFFKQWKNLKAYANRKHIKIIGDLPIYLALDSADAWANTKILKLDKDEKKPDFVAAVPPDAYSEDGQLWGNPIYNWERLEEDGFKFWMDRIRINLRLYDILRLDHFRGFESYYEVPATDENAKYGKWQKAKGDEFFKKIKEEFKDTEFIAEDLGFITKEVEDLKNKVGFPGMKVIQFAFGEDFTSEYLPHNYERNSIVYASTHDSDTLKGWFDNLDEKTKEMVVDYFDIKEDESVNFKIIRALMASVSDIAIFQIQDLLELGNEARINKPGVLGKNWQWRLKKDILDEELSEKIKSLAKLYERGNYENKIKQE